MAGSTDDDLKIERSRLSKQVANMIRDRILTGRLARGDRIVQSRWAEMLGVSRMPVRDAINQLAVEGTLVQSSNGSAVVADIDRGDISDGYELNAIICSFAARRAAERITDEELSELAAVHEAIVEAVKEGDRIRASELNWDFHRRVNEAARSARLTALLRLIAPSIPHSAFELLETWPERAVNDHHEILAALRARDPARAGEITREHIQAGSEDMLARIESREHS